MAKQTGPNPFIGRRGDLLGYRMAGKYYARIVSSLTAERVLTDPAFKQTMQYAGLLGKASKIASAIYRLLPEREHGFYRELTGMAMRLLKQGKTPEETFGQLYNDHLQPLFPVEAVKPELVSNGRLPVLFIHPKAEVCEQGPVSKSQLPDAVFRPGTEVSKLRQAFADELLSLIFSKHPVEQETEKIPVDDHPPSQPLTEILCQPA